MDCTGIGRRTDQREITGAAQTGGEPAQRDSAIHDVLGHVPVFGQLAADHAEHAVRRLGDRMLSRHVRGATRTRVDQGPQPGVAADDIVRSE